VKLVIESISMFWKPLVDIPKGVLENICKININFLWSGKDS
jgi:hypothetical protein